jgi:hypothetical protein
LAEFKEQHGQLLRSFRKRLESQVLDLALVTDESIRNAKLRLFKEELADELQEIEGRMRGRRWPRLVFGTLCGVVGAAIPVGTAAATGAVPLAAAGLPGLAKAAYEAFGAVNSRKDFLREPLAYAALVRERL